MQIFNDLDAMREKISRWKLKNLRIALVPTMGNLHEGHYSLVSLARQYADKVFVSIFVNPTQFGANEDFDRYPRTTEADVLGLKSVGCDAVWLPTTDIMYPLGLHKTTLIHVPGVSEILEAIHRPTHFDGVCTVVARLFLQVQPDVAIFGRKDYQQLAVIKQMTVELSFPIQIIGADIIREEDGLAKSSRNQYLNAEQRLLSNSIYRTLLDMRAGYMTGQSCAKIEADATAALVSVGFQVEYAVLRTSELAEPSTNCDGNLVALIAAVLGTTRLIDNLEFSCPKMQ